MAFRFTVLVFLGLLTFSGCKRNKQQLDCSVALMKYDDDVADKLGEQLSDFDMLTIRSKGSFKSASMDQSFNLLIKMKRDSFVWISATYMIEAARVLITPDSFKLLDRIQRKYYTGSIEQFEKYTGQQLTLRQIQDLLIGNPLFSPSSFVVKHDEIRNDHLQSISNGLINRMHLNGCYRPVKSNFSANNTEGKIDITYSEMEEVKQVGQIPNMLDISAVRGSSDNSLMLNYTSVSTEDFGRVGFVIPSRYEKGN